MWSALSPASGSSSFAAIHGRRLPTRTGRLLLAGVVFTASRRWVAEQGATSLTNLVDQALTTIDPLLAALDQPTPTLQ
jgi:hypothetical protein